MGIVLVLVGLFIVSAFLAFIIGMDEYHYTERESNNRFLFSVFMIVIGLCSIVLGFYVNSPPSTYTAKDFDTADKATKICIDYQLKYGSPGDIATKCYGNQAGK